MRNIPKDNTEFAERLIKLAEEFDTYDFLDNDGNDQEVIEQTTQSIISDLQNDKYDWINEWLEMVKQELTEKTNDPEDFPGADYLGHYIVECMQLMEYIEKM